MSSKKIVLCDLCGKQMNTGITSKSKRFTEAESFDKASILSICSVPDQNYPHGVPYDYGWHRADVCPECQKKFELFVTACREPEETAHWDFWAGWRSNHDHRIEDATCSNCGYKHHTVHSLMELMPSCPQCGRKMEKPT